MWKVPKPVIASRAAFRACISRVLDPAFKARLELVEEDIVGASDEFEVAAAAVTLHGFAKSDNVGGHVTKTGMIRLYDWRFARKGSAGRPIYDAIFAAAPRCPLCGHGTVSTLDHHLPKAHYPALAVAPANLVPACADCNKNKIDAVPLVSEDETLHPYFDDVEDDPWLVAEVLVVAPAALRFAVDPPEHWSPVLAARVRRHFRMLNLPYLYGAQAATEISNIRRYLTTLFARAGIDAVRTHLSETAESCTDHRLNSWQTATYKALAGSEWYCGGGFA